MSRVSFFSRFERPERHLMENTAALDRTMEKISTGKEITRPSDDPPNLVRLFRFHNQQDRVEQYQKNIDSGRNFLQNAEGILDEVTDLTQRVRELGVRAANDSLGAGERNLIAEEVNERLEELVDIANSRLGGRYLFGGTETQNGEDLFSVERDGEGNIIDVTYNGDMNQMENEVGEGEMVVSNLAGHEVFQASNQEITGGMVFDVDDPDAQPLADIEAEDVGSLDRHNEVNMDDEIRIETTEGYFQLGEEEYYYDTSEDSLQDIADRINDRGAPIAADITETEAEDGETYYQLKFRSRTPRQVYMRDVDRNPDQAGEQGLLHDLQFLGDGNFVDAGGNFDDADVEDLDGAPERQENDNFPVSYNSNARVDGKSIFDSIIDLREALQEGSRREREGLSAEDLPEPDDYENREFFSHGNAYTRREVNPFDIPEGIQQGLQDTQEGIDNILVHRSIGGARTNRLDSAEIRGEDQDLHTTELISQLEDADLAEIITDYRRQEAVQQASMRMASQVMQVSLANFI